MKQLEGGAGETRLNCWFKFMEGADIWALGGDSSVFHENDMNMSAGICVLRVPFCRIPPEFLLWESVGVCRVLVSDAIWVVFSHKNTSFLSFSDVSSKD